MKSKGITTWIAPVATVLLGIVITLLINLGTNVLPDVWWLEDWRIIVGTCAIAAIIQILAIKLGASDDTDTAAVPAPIGERAVVGNTLGAGAQITTGDTYQHTVTYSKTPLELPATLGQDGYLARARRLSTARRRSRLATVGLSQPQVAAAMALTFRLDPALSAIQPGQVRVLTGELGAGKTEIAEQWFMDSLARVETDTSAPLPIWVAVQETSEAIEGVIADQVGTERLLERGVDVVVDGLDEKFHEIADFLVQVNAFVEAWPKSRVLVTSRPTGLIPDSQKHNVEGLTDDEVGTLIEAVARPNPHYDHRWTSTLRAMLRRPLFALIAARHIDKVTGVTNPAQLIDLVIGDVVQRQGQLPLEAHRKLAVALTRADGSVDLRSTLTPEEVDAIRASPLLIIDGHTARFTLVTFEQWLAAQALIGTQVDSTEITRSLTDFDHWRYVLAIALATGPADKVDPMMSAVARWNPGAAAWVVQETKRAQFHPSHCTELETTSHAAGQRVRNAIDAWLSGLGPIAGAISIVTASGWKGEGDPLARVLLAVELASGRVTIGLHALPVGADDPPPFVEDASGYRQVRAFDLTRPSPEHQSWTWSMTLDLLAALLDSGLPNLIISDPPAGGVMEAEVYRTLLRQSGEPLTKASLESLLAVMDTPEGRQKLPPGADMLPRSEIENMIRRLDAVESDRYVWPGPDMPPPAAWMPVRYSRHRMHERASAILAGAMQAYVEVADTLFPMFGDALGHRALMPAVLESHITAVDGGSMSDTWIVYWMRPKGRAAESHQIVGNDVALTMNEPGDAIDVLDREANAARYQWFQRACELNPAAQAFAQFSISQSSINFTGKYPATALALSWLWDDLKRLGFVTSHRPSGI